MQKKIFQLPAILLFILPMSTVFANNNFSITDFNCGALTTQSPTTYNAHSGTTTINAKKFTNLNSGVQNGTCIQIGPTSGSGTIIIKNCYFGASVGEAISVENFSG